MSGIIREAKLQTPIARARLKRGRQAHWRTIIPGKAHLGYQRRADDRRGRWLLRRYANGRYSVQALGLADDDDDGNGLTFEQAQQHAQDLAGIMPAPTRLAIQQSNATALRLKKRETRFCLYRLYDGHFKLLYIGISRHGVSRIKGHFQLQRWADEICHITLEDCADDELTALDKEQQAIAAENPKYNVIRRRNKRKWRAPSLIELPWRSAETRLMAREMQARWQRRQMERDL
jgi:hypothetical protein